MLRFKKLTLRYILRRANIAIQIFEIFVNILEIFVIFINILEIFVKVEVFVFVGLNWEDAPPEQFAVRGVDYKVKNDEKLIKTKKQRRKKEKTKKNRFL